MSGSVGTALQEAADRLRRTGSESARLDAEVLLGHVLGVDRTTVLAHPEASVSDGQLAAYRAAVARRADGEPVAYIRGIKEFYGLAFHVDARVLIPRPETESLVDLAVARVREALTGGPRPTSARPFTIWDVGTGSGAIAVALAVTLRRRGYAAAITILATDLSRDALAVAVENAVAHGVADLIEFSQAELFDVPGHERDVDLVLANLPYIPALDVPQLPIAASFEPALALDGGSDGLAVIRRLIRELRGVLSPGGRALLEVGSTQAERVSAEIAATSPEWSPVVHTDLAGQPRVVEIRPSDQVADAPPTHAATAAGRTPTGRSG